MTNPLTKWKNGLLVGAIVAILEGAMIGLADPHTSFWALVQSISFWWICGLVIYMTDTGLPVVLNGILLTVLLNIPWYIALSVVAGTPGHLISLIVASVIFGVIIGLASKKLKPASL